MATGRNTSLCLHHPTLSLTRPSEQTAGTEEERERARPAARRRRRNAAHFLLLHGQSGQRKGVGTGERERGGRAGHSDGAWNKPGSAKGGLIQGKTSRAGGTSGAAPGREEAEPEG